MVPGSAAMQRRRRRRNCVRFDVTGENKKFSSNHASFLDFYDTLMFNVTLPTFYSFIQFYNSIHVKKGYKAVRLVALKRVNAKYFHEL